MIAPAVPGISPTRADAQAWAPRRWRHLTAIALVSEITTNSDAVVPFTGDDRVIRLDGQAVGSGS
ncbi:hypothetical protein Dac01nite_20420 [Demequina activiva]|uniref:Uncharacterized protein n=1 Tax=Demequina activiva TaxID=1582364 RepID=A0A919Q2Z0_9MICO|nr:hypothetical protein Dac01nite_20420 [Demequina activiva]